MSYAAEQIAREEQERAEREMAVWVAICAVREAVKRGDPDAQELIAELKKDER